VINVANLATKDNLLERVVRVENELKSYMYKN